MAGTEKTGHQIQDKTEADKKDQRWKYPAAYSTTRRLNSFLPDVI